MMFRPNTSWWRWMALVAGALGLASLALLAAGADPLQAFAFMTQGAFGSPGNLADVTVAWIPLLLVSAGLLLTFTAGLWNIGVEGQIMAGALACTAILRAGLNSGLPSWLLLMLGVAAGLAGGALLALLAGWLKTAAGIHEIFGGLGLNFVAQALTVWLIFGPWKRPGIGSMSGTEPFPPDLQLAVVPGTRLSPAALVLAAAAVILVVFLLRNTHFGLRLKAAGACPRSARRLGLPVTADLQKAFVLGGALAGLAGALQVTVIYHRLIPAISSGYGFLGLLAVLLAAYRPGLALFTTFFFAALNLGSIQLPLRMGVDSNLAGVMQGLLVLSALVATGLQNRRKAPAERSPA